MTTRTPGWGIRIEFRVKTPRYECTFPNDLEVSHKRTRRYDVWQRSNRLLTAVYWRIWQELHPGDTSWSRKFSKATSFSISKKNPNAHTPCRVVEQKTCRSSHLLSWLFQGWTNFVPCAKVNQRALTDWQHSLKYCPAIHEITPTIVGNWAGGDGAEIASEPVVAAWLTAAAWTSLVFFAEFLQRKLP
jgi:hypothetical protein